MTDSDDIYISTHLGALPLKDGSTFFRVWAPFAETVCLEIATPGGKQRVALHRAEGNYFEGIAEGAGQDDLYRYVIDGRFTLPDPASRSQPHGVHGPSRIVDHTLFDWGDALWKGIPLEEYVIYELHAGTFTDEGTFWGIAEDIEYLLDLGINAVELMPVAQFPGSRNWGYDGVFPFAPHNTYGGPEGLKALVDACHRHGIAVILDVVYNHLGPEGNYLGRFGPYFTDRYHTPWGDAVNFDGPLSDEVRRYFIESALAWIRDYHIDALRIDAIHGIFDFRARTFLEELSSDVRSLGKDGKMAAYLIAESDLNDARFITPARSGGIGLDGQWNDDFHHALHTVLTGEQAGYYRDFGSIRDLAKAFREGYVYTGQYSPYRQKSHGSPSKQRPAKQFVVYSQNHDQVGNRALGDRLSSLVSMEKLKAAAVAVIISPYIPLFFMGEEYGETSPFLYFVHHGDEDLVNAVRAGRAEEFASFGWDEGIPDPQIYETFRRSKINRKMRFTGKHAILFDFYKHLISLRTSLRPWDMTRNRPSVAVPGGGKALSVFMPLVTGDIAVLFNFSEEVLRARFPVPAGEWEKIVDTALPRWGGEGETAALCVSRHEGSPPPLLRLGPSNALVYRREG